MYSHSSIPTSRFSRFSPPSLSPLFSVFILFAAALFVADFPAPSPAHASAFSSRVRLLSLEAYGDKRHRRQKCCPWKWHNDFNVSAVDLLLSPAFAFPSDAGRSVWYSRQQSAIPRFLLNLLTYFTFRVLHPLCPRPVSPLPFSQSFSHDCLRSSNGIRSARPTLVSKVLTARNPHHRDNVFRLKRSSRSKIHKRKALVTKGTKRGTRRDAGISRESRLNENNDDRGIIARKDGINEKSSD